MRGQLIVSHARYGRRRTGFLAYAAATTGLLLVGSLIVSSSVKAAGQAVLTPPSAARPGSMDVIRSHVEEASRRFLIPSSWIWAVMKIESAGDVCALSNKGAMGLMQIMPRTWETLRQRHHLGADPYDPHDNILAGAAYLGELHDRYGERGFLAAYNAGPGRYEDHLNGRRTLPVETVDYVSKVSRRIISDARSFALPSTEDGSSPHNSGLFVGSNLDPRSDQKTDEKRPSERSSIDQRIVDLSAITPRASGLFVALSRP
jgi:hypothetical protein